MVKLSDVINALESTSDESRGFLNRSTGEVFHKSDALDSLERDDEESDAASEPAHDWEIEYVAKCREVEQEADWLPLPDRFEIHEYRMLEDFARSRADGPLRDELLDAIRGRGAFRAFRSTVSRHDVEKEWYAFRDAAYREIAVDWLEEHQIEWQE